MGYKMKGYSYPGTSPLKQDKVLKKYPKEEWIEEVSDRGPFTPPDDEGGWQRISGTKIWKKKKTEGLLGRITARPLAQERLNQIGDRVGYRSVVGAALKEGKRLDRVGFADKMGRRVTGQKTKNSEFDKAFATAREAGEKEFTWKGKKYHTKQK